MARLFRSRMRAGGAAPGGVASVVDAAALTDLPGDVPQLDVALLGHPPQHVEGIVLADDNYLVCRVESACWSWSAVRALENATAACEASSQPAVSLLLVKTPVLRE